MPRPRNIAGITPAEIIDALIAVNPVELWDVLTAKAREADEIRTREMAVKAHEEAAQQRKAERSRIMNYAALARAGLAEAEKQRAEDAKVTEDDVAQRVGGILNRIVAKREASAARSAEERARLSEVTEQAKERARNPVPPEGE